MFFVRRVGLLMFLSVSFLKSADAFLPEKLVITPTTFDFGWCPDNSKISAEFVIKNTGNDVIPISSVQPTCGCTASQFSPASLSSNEETTVGLTFNTRGYAGTGFSKTAKVKTETGGAEFSVTLKGFVLDEAAKVVPDQGGVASFEPGSKEKKKTINIQNKGVKDVTFEIIHQPASWAEIKLASDSLKAGASLPIEISVRPPYDEAKDTSVTIEAKDDMTAFRFTIAIRTGPPPPPVKRASTSTPFPQPAPTPGK